MKPINDKNIINLSKMKFPIDRLINVGYNSYLPSWKMNRSGNKSSLYYILSGTLKFTINNIDYICKENSIFYLTKEENALISNPSMTQKCDLYYITFDFKDNITFKNLYVERPLKALDNKFFNLFKQIHKTHLAEGVAYKIKEFYEFSQLIYELITYKLYTDETFKEDLKISKAVEYMKINYYKNVTVEELSKITGYSVSHFRRLFVKAYGISPQEYMLNYKILKAKEFLLNEQDKTIEEISNLLGFCNPSYFCKLFKNKTGISPYKFKKEIQ